MLRFDEASGAALYAGGTFTESLGSPGNRIARWSGEVWWPLGRGLGGSVYDLAAHDDGGGLAIYATGPFTRAGEILAANAIARWDGREWSALGTGLTNEVPPHFRNGAALIAFDDGSGPALYVGGHFTHASGMPAINVARWDGQKWSALGEGLRGGVVGVRDFAIYDDGSGPALYAGGFLDIGGVARWDGQSWSRVGDSFVGYINAMAVFNDGTGPALYAGGQMHVSSGHPGNGIARWDGARWTPLGAGVDYDVFAMHVFDDGTGPALYVGGTLYTAGGKEVWGIARWDGEQWHDLDGGVRGGVFAMTTFDDGSGPALYVAGKFDLAGGPGGIPVENIARWRCERSCPADCDRDGSLTFFDFLCFQNLFAAMDPAADCDGDTELTFFDFLCFQNAFAAGCE